ncbi:ABC transporter ATP-binding protein [Capnocytophaga sp. ARDL2]|uniref:ABC transporter ATP-binding protein n=1 Tax=Capnocytophaga sp. ARDL2 TaxID=3238809 RepID=UPI00355860C5
MKTLTIKTLKQVFDYALPYKNKILAVVLSLLALSIFGAIRPYMVKNVIDSYIETKDLDGLFWYSVLMVVVLVVEVVGQFLFTYTSNWLGQNIIRDIRRQLFDKLMGFYQKYFDNEAVGKLITRNISDIENISSIFSQGLFMIIADALRMLIILIMMLYMNSKLTIIVVIFMPVLLYATRVFQQKMKVAFEEVRTQVANLNTYIQERLTGIQVVQLFAQEEADYQKFKEINKKHNDAWQKNILYNSIFFPVADILSSITLGCVIIYGGFSILQFDGLTTTGDLFAYTMMISMLFNPLRQIADKFNVMQMGIIAAERVFEILNKDEHTQPQGTIDAPDFEGDIQLKNVVFGYKEGEKVLNNLNLTIPKGKTVAIVGASGAGKSTIVNLLNRFYDIQGGEIRIDNQNINDYTLESLRKQISVVLQDVFMFNDTIFNNIALYNPAITKEQVQTAAQQIGIDSFINSLPEGFDYVVKERGAMLSTGQRQLIAFLRAYISNPSILVLDEATSSIDTHSEELIQKALNVITKGRTSIIIAHRLATIVHADIILVMHGGKVVEQGNHDELIAQKGYYYQLHEAQYALEE